MQWLNMYVCVCGGGGGCNSNPNTRLFSFSAIFRTDKDAAFPGPNGTKISQERLRVYTIKKSYICINDTILHTKNISDRVKRRRKPP